MNIFYAFNLIDFILRLAIVGQVFLIFLNIRRIDINLLKSLTYLKFNTIRKASKYVLFSSPFFLIASLLEYPGFRFIYGEDSIHLVQDMSLFIFQISVIYFLTIVHKALKLPEH